MERKRKAYIPPSLTCYEMEEQLMEQFQASVFKLNDYGEGERWRPSDATELDDYDWGNRWKPSTGGDIDDYTAGKKWEELYDDNL